MPEEEAFPPVESAHDRPMARPRVPEAEALIGVKHPVLEHGYVVLVDYMGDDSAIVQAARVSYGLGTKSARDDRALLRYLMRHRHTTPFEMVEFKFLVRLPMYVARQWIRHRTASTNEYSARYSIVPDEYELPPPGSVRGQAGRNRQGRSGEPLPPGVVEEFREGVRHLSEEAYDLYTKSLEKGVARELSRIVLPVGFYTEWYWKTNLHNLFHFLHLRLDDHAQEEIQRYAGVIAGIVRSVVPVAYEAFEDFVLEARTYSRPELLALAEILEGKSVEEACRKAGLPLAREDGTPRKSGEGVEFVEKLPRRPSP